MGFRLCKITQEKTPGVAVSIKSAKSYEDIAAVAQNLADAIKKDNILKDARSDLSMNQKSFHVKILREPLAALGIDEKSLSIALQTFRRPHAPF